MRLEVIATDLTDAKLADQHGADRIELVTGMAEGGLTPSHGLIEEVVERVSIPAYVMIRPHSRSFCYNRDDLDTMIKDIHAVKRLGAPGVVLGALTEEKTIDEAALQSLLEAAEGLDVTFHRAFDEVKDQEAALETLLCYPQVTRVLTSGGKKSALDAVPQLAKLVRMTRGTHLTILAGSGLTVESLPAFVEQTGVLEVHFGSGVRVNGKSLEPIDPAKITELKALFG
ncbi:copper homeostasis protein CutC [Laceyella putida]|uniref:PF03932 family protein CutC n=1 Tax=Laceyella putida TaxID=110101 RepID=A0ABW2RM03_9BACL